MNKQMGNEQRLYDEISHVQFDVFFFVASRLLFLIYEPTNEDREQLWYMLDDQNSEGWKRRGEFLAACYLEKSRALL